MESSCLPFTLYENLRVLMVYPNKDEWRMKLEYIIYSVPDLRLNIEFTYSQVVWWVVTEDQQSGVGLSTSAFLPSVKAGV